MSHHYNIKIDKKLISPTHPIFTSLILPDPNPTPTPLYFPPLPYTPHPPVTPKSPFDTPLVTHPITAPLPRTSPIARHHCGSDAHFPLHRYGKNKSNPSPSHHAPRLYYHPHKTMPKKKTKVKKYFSPRHSLSDGKKNNLVLFRHPPKSLG